MNSPVIPVSWGELWDKITILRIKVQKLRSASARSNAVYELSLLESVAGQPDPDMEALVADLQAVNRRLWDIEDQVREHEAADDFGATFVALARAVYRENDERWRIKAEINKALRSAVVEEKQYPPYGSSP